jgi:hypothetical protein
MRAFIKSLCVAYIFLMGARQHVGILLAVL